MYNVQRQSQILEILEREGQVDVNKLAPNFNASKETIRRDLKAMESSGLLQRTHGGAILIGNGYSQGYEFPLFARNIKNFDIKQRLCHEASKLLEDGDTIFLDNSSTTMNFLHYVPQNIKITVVTNSIQVLLSAVKNNKNDNITVISVGGSFNFKNYSVSGMLANQAAKDIFPDKAIISCRGINALNGMTDGSFLEVEVKRIMINNSKTLILLLDHSKFGQNGVVSFGSLDTIDFLITDPDVNKENLQMFNGCKVKIIIAPQFADQDIQGKDERTSS
jgi:DeoR family fructose operon transcriptional repressor